MSPNEHVVAALAALRVEHTAALDRARDLKEQLDSAAAEVAQLETAIKSLEPLAGPAEGANTGSTIEVTGIEGQTEFGRIEVSVKAPHPDVSKIDGGVPERLAGYVPPGGQRLRSKGMVVDLLDKIGQPVTRERLRKEFFDYYGRETLEHYWERPDSALNTAIDRASQEGSILQVDGQDGRPLLYTPGFLDRQTGRPANEVEDD